MKPEDLVKNIDSYSGLSTRYTGLLEELDHIENCKECVRYNRENPRSVPKGFHLNTRYINDSILDLYKANVQSELDTVIKEIEKL